MGGGGTFETNLDSWEWFWGREIGGWGEESGRRGGSGESPSYIQMNTVDYLFA